MGTSTSDSSTEDEDVKSKHTKHKKHSKKSRSSKHKKDKKHKKLKSRKRYYTSESSSASENEEWVVKGNAEAELEKVEPNVPMPMPISTSNKSSFVKPPEDDGNDWANFGSAIPTYSNTAKKEKRQTKKEWDAVRSSSKLGQHSRELNPYWKDGGCGLPSASLEKEANSPSQNSSSSAGAGDGGLQWLRRAYQRAKEQAKEEERSLEEVATERWGSLEIFYGMLEAAEAKAGGGSQSRDEDNRHNRDRKDSRSSFKRPRHGSSSEDDKSSRSSRGNERHQQSRNYASSNRSSHREREAAWMKKPSAAINNRELSPDSRSHPTSVTVPVSSKIAPIESPKSLKQMDADETPEEKEITPPVLTDQEMNSLSAKILKAEMLGNTVLAADLKKKHAEAEANRQKFIKGGGDLQNPNNSTKVVTKIVMGSENRGRRIRDKPSETHKDGQRVRYFPDDDKQSLQNMFQREKANTAEDENALFSRLAGKGMKSKPTDDYDLDDIFADKAGSSKKVEKEKEKEVRRVIEEEKFYNKTVEDCQWCFDGSKLEKNIVISIGEKSYICVPPFQSLSEGHCLIVPMSHASASTELDEDVWSEMQKFRHALVRMFRDQDQDVVIFETAVFLKRLPHMYLEIVPMPKETGELAPIYFKKAIQECETEWSQNKKLVDLRNRDVRKGVPKGLPYFFVDFGDDSGFAHVIEDERNFPRNFAQEIIGGMMELDHSLWRKRKNISFNDKKEKLMNFLKTWGPYDWTRDG